MTTTHNPPRTWSIQGARHAGITVRDLDRSLVHYCDVLGMELLWRRLYEEPDVREIVGMPEASALDIAMVQVPGGDPAHPMVIELLAYQGIERHPGSTRPCDWGTGHFCVFVDDIEALYADLAARGVRFRSAGPVEMQGGANRGGKSLYSLDPDGYILELHQRPPTTGDAP
jgi:catechol 2,3-dioxygenase-like lactoylglutathione lyase family enzyme